MIYSIDNTNNCHPPRHGAMRSNTSVGVEKIFKCPAANSGSRCDYAFNAKLGGMDEGKINPQTVMIFESDGGWNANGGPECMIAKPRHARECSWSPLRTAASIRCLNPGSTRLRWDP